MMFGARQQTGPVAAAVMRAENSAKERPIVQVLRRAQGERWRYGFVAEMQELRDWLLDGYDVLVMHRRAG